MKEIYVISVVSSEEQTLPITSTLVLPAERPIVIGRGEDCDLVLPCKSRYLSRAHLRIQWMSKDNITVSNISNSNSCVVNSVSIMPGESSLLAPGQEIILGRYTLQLNINKINKDDFSSELTENLEEQQAFPTIESTFGDESHTSITSNTSLISSNTSLDISNDVESGDDLLLSLLDTPSTMISAAPLLDSNQSCVIYDAAELKTQEIIDPLLSLQKNDSPPSDAAPLTTKEALGKATLAIPLDSDEPLLCESTTQSSIDTCLNNQSDPKLTSETMSDLAFKQSSSNSPEKTSLPEIRKLKKAFATGCGIHEAVLPEFNEDFIEELGSLLHLLTKGTLSLIHGRAITKHEMRANVTIINTEGNNPLKFAPDSQSALMQLLSYKLPGFMSPSDAIQDAFTDLLAHQVGLLGGARNAIYDVLENFSPNTLVHKCPPPSSMSAMLPYYKYKKYWETYINSYESISGNARDEFEKIFEAAFIRAYEKEAKITKRETK